MQRKALFTLSIILLLTLSLTACQPGAAPSESNQNDIAQTLVAMAFTQTAIASNQVAPTATPEAIATTPSPEQNSADSTPSPTTEIIHNITPGEPGWVSKWFYDTDSSRGTVTAGDDFVANLYERPFTENEMIYRPDLDINKAEISEDGTFYYVSLYLHGEHPDGGLRGSYGVELDTNRDGRGDLLVIASHPQNMTWDIAGVSVHKDPNKNVGGSFIMRPDTQYSGDGYEQVVFSMDELDDPDAAWARVSADTPGKITLAFKKSLTAGYGTFVWGVWAADNLLDPVLIDLHDNFTQAEAGSPYPAHSTYPLKALHSVDNTCRETYGFEAEVPIPGLCYLPEKPTPTPTVTATIPSYTATITTYVFWDHNGNGRKDAGDDLVADPAVSFTVYVRANNCGSPALQNTNSNQHTFTVAAPGTYCVNISLSGADLTTASGYIRIMDIGNADSVFFGVDPLI